MARDKPSWTALHDAVRARSRDVVSRLIDKGADVNATDKDGRTALHEAVRARSRDMVSLLIGEGADINAIDKEGRTALHEAVRAKSRDIFVYLVGKAADPVVITSFLAAVVDGVLVLVKQQSWAAGLFTFCTLLCLFLSYLFVSSSASHSRDVVNQQSGITRLLCIHFAKALFQSLLFHLGICERQLPKGFVRLKWVCSCGRTFFEDYPESFSPAAQQMQLTLKQSGYQATVFAYRKQESTTQRLLVHVPGFDSHGTATSELASNPQDETSHEIIQEHHSQPIIAEGASQLKRSSTSPLANRHRVDNNLEGSFHPSKQWLLLCFYHNRYLNRAVHMEVGEDAYDIELISQFQRFYYATRGILRYFIPWRKVTNIKFVRFQLTKDEPAEDIDLALLNDDWAPPPGWTEHRYWNPRPTTERPKLERWIMHLWEKPHDSPAYLALMNVAFKSRKRFVDMLRTLPARFRYFRGLSDTLRGIQDPECQDMVGIHHLANTQGEGNQNCSNGGEKGRFFFHSTPKRLSTRLQASSNDPPLGWGLFFEENTVVPTFVKVFIFFLVISSVTSIAVVCFELAHNMGYDVFGMGSFTIGLASIMLTLVLKFI